MSVIGEGIECLVTKTIHTQVDFSLDFYVQQDVNLINNVSWIIGVWTSFCQKYYLHRPGRFGFLTEPDPSRKPL